jgi:multidrug efflux pump subunit AcrA (membrane-fusion protein)
MEVKMKTTHKQAFYSVIILLILFAAGCDSLNLTGSDGAQLHASGIVEAVDVTVSPEQAGRVAEVYAVEGDQVQSGDPLFVLEDKTLVAHHELALADLESAQANLGTAQAGLELAKANLRASEVNVEAADAAAEVQLLPVQQALDDLHDNVEVARGEALKVVSVANRAERDAQYCTNKSSGILCYGSRICDERTA